MDRRYFLGLLAASPLGYLFPKKKITPKDVDVVVKYACARKWNACDEPVPEWQRKAIDRHLANLWEKMEKQRPVEPGSKEVYTLIKTGENDVTCIDDGSGDRVGWHRQ